MSEVQPTSSQDIRFYRKPWFFFLSILVFWPFSLFLMLTGKTYYTKSGGQIVQMKRWSKALLFIVILFGGLLFYARIAAQQSPPNVTASNTVSDGSASTDQTAPAQAAADASSTAATPSNNDLSTCDSDETKDAVKQALEQNDGIRVLDMGNFVEIACPALNMNDGSCMSPSDKDRYCNATVSLNTGTTAMKVHLFYGPSGKPLVQVEVGAWTDWSKLK